MDEFRELMAGILMCDADELPPDTTPLRDLEGWDSLKHVLLVVSLENKLNSKLTAEEIQSMVNLGDVARTLNREGVDA